MTFDVADAEVVYFGGAGATSVAQNSTWIFHGGAWSNITNYSDAPPARWGAAMTYDYSTGVVLLFGGCSTRQCPRSDTWSFSAGDWTNISATAGVPPAAYDSVMASSITVGTVMFGGCTSTNCTSVENGTFFYTTFAGCTAYCWVDAVYVNAPPARAGEAFAYDPNSGYYVLYGGLAPCLALVTCGLNDTWTFSGSGWTDVTYPGSPSFGYPNHPRALAGMGWDGVDHYLLLFGGRNVSSGLDYAENWAFSSGLWTLVTPLHSPANRQQFALVQNSSGGPLLLFGGLSGSLIYADTWVYESAPLGVISVQPGAPETNQTVYLNGSATSGRSPYTFAWTSGDGTSASGTQVTHIYTTPGRYIVTLTVADAFGVRVVISHLLQVTTPSVIATASRAATDVGLNITFTATPSGGTAPYALNWSFGDGNRSLGPSVVHQYPRAASYNIVVLVTDKVGSTNRSALAVAINPNPSVVLSATPSAPAPNDVVSYSATTVGGTGPFTFVWGFGDGTGSTLQNPTHPYASAGTYSVSLWANDTVGVSAHTNYQVVVTATSTSSSGSPFGALALGILIGVGLLILIGVIVLILSRRRHRGPRTPPAHAMAEWSPPGTGEEPSPVPPG